jgi:pyridoxal phosphate enzyme (YggS family)
VSTVADNVARIRQRIAAAAQRVGRDPAEVRLIGVTKSVPPARVDEAVRAGVELFGESKIQEARAKIPACSGRARWHFIGHLQSNKARWAVELFELIHSVDRVALAVELNRWAERAGRRLPVLLQVNVTGEKSRFGLAPDELPAAWDQLQGLGRLEVRGLMTLPPYHPDPERARPYFQALRQWRDRLGLRELSMGMSGDFEVAVEEGATFVRVGTAIFGERIPHESGE